MLFQINLCGVRPEETANSNRIYPVEGYGTYNYALKTNIGTLKNLSLPHSFRMCFDNFAEYMTDAGGKGLYKRAKATISSDAEQKPAYNGEKGQDRVIGSVGRWYAGYALPTTTVAVYKDLNLSDAQVANAISQKDKSKILSNGYIIVTFDIMSKAGTDPYLQYYGPEARFQQGADLGEEITPSTSTNPSIDLNKPEIDWKDRNSPTIEITLPSGKPAIVPKSAVSLFESDTSVQIDTRSDIIY